MKITILLYNHLLQFLAIIALFLALYDASILLGVGAGDISPIAKMGLLSFMVMAFFAILRIFGAVGMWIGAGWGAPLLVIVTMIELILLLIGSSHIIILQISLSIRLFIFLGIGVWLILHIIKSKEDVYH